MNYLSKVLFGNEDQSLLAIIPSRQLLDQSLHLVAPKKQFNGWSAQDHADSYLFMQRIAQAWKSSNLTNQYLIYGKIDSNLFNWEIVPYRKCRTCIGRVVQQLQVLRRIVFGGMTVSEKSSQNQLERYEVLLRKSPKITEPSDISSKSNDSFCKDDTIERQWVIIGKK